LGLNKISTLSSLRYLLAADFADLTDLTLISKYFPIRISVESAKSAKSAANSFLCMTLKNLVWIQQTFWVEHIFETLQYFEVYVVEKDGHVVFLQ
jgi:hypothetical protein